MPAPLVPVASIAQEQRWTPAIGTRSPIAWMVGLAEEPTISLRPGKAASARPGARAPATHAAKSTVNMTHLRDQTKFIISASSHSSTRVYASTLGKKMHATTLF